MEDDKDENNSLNNLVKCLWYKASTKMEKYLLATSTIIVSVVVVLIITLSIILQTSQVNVCWTPSCIQKASLILQSVNLSAEPCQDFYQFTCGNFLGNEYLADAYNRVTWLTIVQEAALCKMKALLEELDETSIRPYRLLQNLYNLCKDESDDNDVIEITKAYLMELGGWPLLEEDDWKDIQFNWPKSVYTAKQLGISTDFFVALNVDVNYGDPSRYAITIDKPTTLIMGNEFLSDTLSASSYYEFIVHIAVNKFGANEDVSRRDLKNVIELEKRLSKLGLNEAQNINYTYKYNAQRIKDLQHQYPSINWIEYINTTMALSFEARLTKEEIIIVKDVKYLQGLVTLLIRTPKRTLANYIMMKVVLENLRYLSSKVQTQHAEYYNLFTAGINNESREKNCVRSVWERLHLAAEALYTNHHFHDKIKEKSIAIATEIKNQFRRSIVEIEWMDAKSKMASLEKIDMMDVSIGYPEEYLMETELENFYSTVNIANVSYLEAVKRLNMFTTDNIYKRLRQPVTKVNQFERITKWGVEYPKMYSPTRNAVVISPIIAEAALSDEPNLSYLDFGTFGFIVALEISQGFNIIGSQFNSFGKLEDIWWRNETKLEFISKLQCYTDQYGYSDPSNASYIITRIMAVTQAFRAYEVWSRSSVFEALLPGLDYNANQMYWIAVGQIYCSKSFSALPSTKSDLNRYQAHLPLNNLKSFASDFNCPLVSNIDPCNIM